MFKVHKISIKDKILLNSIWLISFSHKSNKCNKMLEIANIIIDKKCKTIKFKDSGENKIMLMKNY